MISDVDININDNELFKYADYRSFVRHYVYYKTAIKNLEHEPSIINLASYAQTNLHGLTYRHVVKTLIEDFAGAANNKTELSIVLNNLHKIINDPFLQNTIENYIDNSYRNQFETKLSENALIFAVIFLCLFILVVIIQFLRRNIGPTTRKSSTARWLIYGFYILTAISIVSFLEEAHFEKAKYFAYQFLFVISVYFVHTFIIITKLFFTSKRKIYFITILTLLTD